MSRAAASCLRISGKSWDDAIARNSDAAEIVDRHHGDAKFSEFPKRTPGYRPVQQDARLVAPQQRTMFMKVDDLFTGSVGVKKKNGVNLTIDGQFPPLRHKGDLHFLVTEAGTESNFLASVIDEQGKSGVTFRTRAREARAPDRIVLPVELFDLHYSSGSGSMLAPKNQGND